MTTNRRGIVPHGPGIDICSNGHSIYIIRSDLGCYMKLEQGSLDRGGSGPAYPLNIYPLNPSCAGADHYVNRDGTFYIIRGNSFVCVSDLTAPTHEISVQSLSPKCHGTHFLSVGGNFVVILASSSGSATSNYIVVSDLATGAQIGGLYDVAPENQNGLYYYGGSSAFPDSISIIRPVSEWGSMFTVLSQTLAERAGISHFVHPNVINFLPGGLSVTFGIAEAMWVPVKTFTNTSEAALEWSESITKSVGYNKSHFQSIESNWSATASVSIGTKYSASFIVETSLEAQFSLSGTYGGVSTRSQQEDWNEAYTTQETLSTTIGPGKTVYIWQFRLGLKGTATVLFCRDLQITNTSDPPTNIPLPHGP